MKPTAQLPESAERIVAPFLEGLSSIAQGSIEGVYLTGSLAMGDFHPTKSDIDFLVLCKSVPTGEDAARIKRLHSGLTERFPEPSLSGVYFTADVFENPRPQEARVLAWHNGRLGYQTFEMAPISLAELRQCSITLCGQPAQSLPVRFETKSLIRFLHENINTYWTCWINRHSSWVTFRSLLVLFPRLTEWSVLGVARQLCTLQTGRVVSKTEAGKYCLEKLPPQFHPVIREAIEIRHDARTYPLLRSYGIRPSLRRAAQTVACVRHIIALFNEIFEAMDQGDTATAA